MADFPNSAPAPKIHPFVIKGRAGDFPASQVERLALYRLTGAVIAAKLEEVAHV